MNIYEQKRILDKTCVYIPPTLEEYDDLYDEYVDRLVESWFTDGDDLFNVRQEK